MRRLVIILFTGIVGLLGTARAEDVENWDKILGNRFLTIRYEDLVADVDAHAARILEFCGLDWEDACAIFWTSPRVVNTISSVQVRQPPTRFSGRRNRYARHLAPLLAALRDAGVAILDQERDRDRQAVTCRERAADRPCAGHDDGSGGHGEGRVDVDPHVVLTRPRAAA